jgi:hypothetical protein
MSLPRAIGVVRASAFYDLVATVGFAFPFTAPLIFTGLGALNDALGLAGATPDPTDPFTVMFANLMGGLVIVWAVFRLARPSREAGAADVVGRLFFSLGMVAALLNGASSLVGVLLVLEVLWAVVQAAAVVTARPRALRFES